MFLPYYPKDEIIGDSRLFYGREKEIASLLEWAEGIPKKLSKSKALLATKKMGKTALLERLYNILFVRKGSVIPFYFRIPERNVWEQDFAQQFYFTFLTQYLAFKLDQPEWANEIFSGDVLIQIAKQNQLEKIVRDLTQYDYMKKDTISGGLWLYAARAPHRMAAITGDFFLQIIDEFQFFNQYIYVDQNLKHQVNLAGTYLEYAESKIAPLLISGSYLGWLRRIMEKLTSRFPAEMELRPFPPEEGLEAIYRYGEIYDVNLTEDSALEIQNVSWNHPYYISSIFYSAYPGKKLSTPEGVGETVNYEIGNTKGDIYKNWMEYISYAFSQTNGRMAKAIILFLSQNREEEKTRAEILDHLKKKKITTLEDGTELDDTQLEKRLILLARSDVIEMGSTAFRYKGIPDVIFHQVFQLLYSEEIDNVKKEETLAAIGQRSREDREKIEVEMYRQNKGLFLEFAMVRFLLHRSGKKGTPSLHELVQNLPDSASFVSYQTVSDCHFNLPGGHHRQFDVLARAAQEDQPSLLIECKYREKPVDATMVEKFSQAFQEVQQQISLSPKSIPIIYSISGFTTPALERMKELHIAWSTPEEWMILSEK